MAPRAIVLLLLALLLLAAAHPPTAAEGKIVPGGKKAKKKTKKRRKKGQNKGGSAAAWDKQGKKKEKKRAAFKNDMAKTANRLKEKREKTCRGIVDAARKGDLDYLKPAGRNLPKHERKRMKVSCHDENGYTPLHHAARKVRWAFQSINQSINQSI